MTKSNCLKFENRHRNIPENIIPAPSPPPTKTNKIKKSRKIKINGRLQGIERVANGGGNMARSREMSEGGARRHRTAAER